MRSGEALPGGVQIARPARVAKREELLEPRGPPAWRLLEQIPAGRATVRHLRAIISVCVCLCGARVRMCTGVVVRHMHSLTHLVTFVFVCAFE